MLMLLLIPASNHPIEMISVKLLGRDPDTICANILCAVYNYCAHQEGMKGGSMVARPLMFQPVLNDSPWCDTAGLYLDEISNLNLFFTFSIIHAS